MFRRVSLPNQLHVWAPSALEAAIVYREVVTEGTYQSHGIVLDEAPIVFDIGANIGLFSMHVSALRPRARVHAFEPIPVLHDILRRNLAEHAPEATAYDVGVGASRGEATFDFNPYMTITSTMHPEVFARPAAASASVSSWMAAGLRDLEAAAPSRSSRALSAGLANRALRPVVTALLLPIAAVFALRGRLFLQRPRCRIETLSSLIAATGVPRIDLVKIDVEGAEEEVIAGVADDDWPRIRQMVVEVHDVDGRLERLTRRLRALGFTTTHAREDWATHEMLGIWTLYARRDA